MKFYKGIEGLRGVCALAVAFAHFDARLLPDVRILSRPALAVEAFFIISGFILLMRYADEVHCGAMKLREFAERRIYRLFPLHAFCLLLLLGFYFTAYLITPHQGVSFTESFPVVDDGRRYGEGIWYNFFTDFFLLNGIGTHHLDATWNYPSWTISSELWVGILFAFLYRLPKRGLVLISACVVGAAYAILFHGERGLAGHSRASEIYLDVGLLRTLAGFSLGTLLAIYLERVPRNRLLLDAVSLAALVPLLMIFVDAPRATYDFAAIPLLTIIVGASIIETSTLARMLSLRVFEFLGKISYSVYLNHVLVIGVLQFTLFGGARPAAGTVPLWLAVSQSIAFFVTLLGLSSLTFSLVERPAKQTLYRWMKSRGRSGQATPAS
ncbi:MAG: acyltransferase [Hyphomonas sp.]